MDKVQEDRLVVAFERIGYALEGLRGELKKAGARYWPEPKEQKQAVVSRVESDKDREQRLQGTRHRTVAEVVDPETEDEDEYIGERERQWKRDHPATASTNGQVAIDDSPQAPIRKGSKGAAGNKKTKG